MGVTGVHRQQAGRTPLRVVVAGSHKLPRGLAPRILLRFLLKLHEDSTIILRKGRASEPGAFEKDVHELCDRLMLRTEWFQPDTQSTHGRASVFLRDIEMVASADLVVLFIAHDDMESGYSGTFHLWDKSLDEHKPVYAWSVAADGAVDRWGESDEVHHYAPLFE